MKNIFTQHPKSMNETYFQHLLFALGFSGRLFVAAICCFIHALFPFVFQKTGSTLIFKMAAHLTANKRKEVEEEVLGEIVNEQVEHV